MAAILLVALLAAGVALAFPSLRAWYHLRSAREALEHYHNPQAIRHLQVCMRSRAHDPDVLMLAARAARRARVYSDAERCLEEYQQVRGLDEALSFEQLLLTAERQVDQVAEACRRRVEQGDPDTPLILEALVGGFMRQYRIREARACLDRWLELEPGNAQAYYLEGQFRWYVQKTLNRAEESYRHAVELDPEHEEARLGLVIVLLEAKKFADAVDHLEYLRQHQPNNLRVVVGLAQCRHALGQDADAERLVAEVLERQSEYPPALALRGQLLLEKDEPVEAEEWLRRAVARDPTDHQASYNLLLCLHRNGKEEEARRHQEQLKQWEEDVKRIQDIITGDLMTRPHDPALHCQLGELLLRSGHPDEGRRWLHSALRLDPSYEPARQALAKQQGKAAMAQ